MMDYNARHQNLPEMDAFLRQANSDVKDSLLDPAKYTADRMERLRSVLSAEKPIRRVAQPVDELPEIAEAEEDEEAPAQEQPESARMVSDLYRNLQFYQSPYANRSRGILSPMSQARVNSPLMRRMTTIMDVTTPGGADEDGELPEVPVSQIQNRRELKVPYEPEPQDPYTFPATSNEFP